MNTPELVLDKNSMEENLITYYKKFKKILPKIKSMDDFCEKYNINRNNLYEDIFISLDHEYNHIKHNNIQAILDNFNAIEDKIEYVVDLNRNELSVNDKEIYDSLMNTIFEDNNI
jgi:hypothetical protein